VYNLPLHGLGTFQSGAVSLITAGLAVVVVSYVMYKLTLGAEL